jgi:hypothetical protein
VTAIGGGKFFLTIVSLVALVIEIPVDALPGN